ncbi:MAG TPA: DUF4124 domain-containing protein [Burkholderiales bacterium]|nr:DUF4124 domain-containing protein [Burkholderiales bacterium]
MGLIVPERALMKTSSLVPILILLAAAPAQAQIYKWVDESGQTHYSDKAPAGARKTATVADRVSTYTPDPALLARASAAPAANTALAERVDSLERALQYERFSRQQTELAAYTQEAEAGYGYYPYAVPVPVQLRHRHPGFRPRPAPRTVVGPGIMPGTFNGPNAVTAGNVTLRTSLAAPRGRGAASF